LQVDGKDPHHVRTESGTSPPRLVHGVRATARQPRAV